MHYKVNVEYLINSAAFSLSLSLLKNFAKIQLGEFNLHRKYEISPTQQTFVFLGNKRLINSVRILGILQINRQNEYNWNTQILGTASSGCWFLLWCFLIINFKGKMDD